MLLSCGVWLVWLWAGHIPSVQQAIVPACHAATHNGDHRRMAASKHTHAANFFPGAIGNACAIALIEDKSYNRRCGGCQRGFFRYEAGRKPEKTKAHHRGR
jgi:hypothetical protein